ncbi:MAG: nicotinamide-nucleotide amidohydrolase family protein [Clostridia bacterium]|nr:nicotinamide-nucleotide amidohydrolase family protein [Clostridia bacterium]
MTREIRLFGVAEETLQQRLRDLLDCPESGVTLSYCGGHGVVTLTGDPEAVEGITDQVVVRLGSYVYSYEGESLAACVVRLLNAHGLTVATAESCTGGLIAAALTDVPGASRVFGTGVVSYSNECKEKLLAVSPDTLEQTGAVSAATAGQMARGVRQSAGAHIGVSVTGEAGPQPAEDRPVGTVFIALADKKRTWVEELHLDGPDRAAIRRQAADQVLWLLWRYLSAYPAVMAGGERRPAAGREIPRTQGAKHPRLLARLLPWRGDSLWRVLIKCVCWLLVITLIGGCLLLGYRHLLDPDRNRQLQDQLGDLYWEAPTDLTGGADTQEVYPEGMMALFQGLYDMNEDIGGWIYIPDTNIDYPVMQYTDAYYRNHSFLKQLSIYGQLYFGEYDEQGKYTRIYGQNTGDGQMLSDLLNYRRIAYLQEHPYVECSTLYERSLWEIFAVFVIDERDTDDFSLTEGVKSYKDFVAELQARSLFVADSPVTEQDNFLLISTDAQTEYDFAGARLVVAARQVTDRQTPPAYRINNNVRMPKALTAGRRTTRTTRTTTRTTTTAVTTTTVTTTSVTRESQTTVTTSTIDRVTQPSTVTTVADNGTDTTTGTALPVDGTTATDTTADSTTQSAEESTTAETTQQTEIQDDADIGN